MLKAVARFTIKYKLMLRYSALVIGKSCVLYCHFKPNQPFFNFLVGTSGNAVRRADNSGKVESVLVNYRFMVLFDTHAHLKQDFLVYIRYFLTKDFMAAKMAMLTLKVKCVYVAKAFPIPV